MSRSGGAAVAPHAVTSHAPPAGNAGIRVVITGKGGVGKTTITALLARWFAGHGKQVLAVDGDPQKNLAAALGLLPEDADRIVPVSESAAYLRQKTGAGPDLSPGGLITLNPDVSDVVDRFSVPVDQNLRLLVMGGVRMAGSGCLCPEYTLLAAILRHLQLLPDDVVLLDTPAGPEHFGRAVAEGFTCAVVMADPSYNALAVARESAALAGQLGIGRVILAINRARDEADEQKARTLTGWPAPFPPLIMLPFDLQVTETEPSVAPLTGGTSAFLEKVQALAGIIAGPV